MTSRSCGPCLSATFVLCLLFSTGALQDAVAQNSANLQPSSRPPYRVLPYLRDNLNWNWNQRGRTVPAEESSAGLRLRAYQYKLAMRAARVAAEKRLSKSPSSTLTNTLAPLVSASAWMQFGPAPLASDATGNGFQDYNWVSGRATAVLIDPADTSGNTVFLGGAEPTPPVTVTVSTGAQTIIYPNFPGWPDQTAQFLATVSNASNPAVTWEVATANAGSIDANGVYTAPLAADGFPTTVKPGNDDRAIGSKSRFPLDSPPESSVIEDLGQLSVPPGFCRRAQARSSQ